MNDQKLKKFRSSKHTTITAWHWLLLPWHWPDYNLEIEDPMVVTKSYPSFWEDLKNCGI
jgi:hypothetical protein